MRRGDITECQKNTLTSRVHERCRRQTNSRVYAHASETNRQKEVYRQTSIRHTACGTRHTAYCSLRTAHGSFLKHRRKILPPCSVSQDVNTSRLLCRVTDTRTPLCGIEHIMNLLDRVVVVLSCCHLDVVLKMAEMDPRYFTLRLKIVLEKKSYYVFPLLHVIYTNPLLVFIRRLFCFPFIFLGLPVYRPQLLVVLPPSLAPHLRTSTQ